MSWYDLWSNWLNTTIRTLKSEHNSNCVGYYYFKSNSNRNKSKYKFGTVPHFEHKYKWKRTHRGKRGVITNGYYKGEPQ